MTTDDRVVLWMAALAVVVIALCQVAQCGVVLGGK